MSADAGAGYELDAALAVRLARPAGEVVRASATFRSDPCDPRRWEGFEVRWMRLDPR